MGGEDRQIISTGNSTDKKIADGLPLESLTLIEGENRYRKECPHPADHLGCHETGILGRSLHHGKHEQEFHQTDGIDES